MKMTEFSISGPKLLEPQMFGDARGFFVERYHAGRFAEAGIPANDFMQDNFSRSAYGVLRGLHYQYDLPQGKLVTAVAGRIFDVIVDIRHKSPTFGQSIGVELDGSKPTWLWVPAGFAHGFVVISREGADIMYKVTAPYNPQGESGILWNDADLGIQWPVSVEDALLSPRDLVQPKWTDYRKAPKF